jgi:TonB family protein
MSSNCDNTSLRSRWQIVFLTTFIFAAVATTQGQTLQVSPNGDSRAIITTALRRERATLLGFRQVWSIADQKAARIMEVVKPDRLRTVQKDQETIYIGDMRYERKGNGPWRLTSEFVMMNWLPEGDVEEEVKQIGQIRLIGPDTLEDLSVLVYEYQHTDAAGKASGSRSKIWIGVKDGLPHKAEDEGQYPAVSDGVSPEAKAGVNTANPTMISVKVVTTFDYNGSITVDLPERAAREAAESWLQLIDAGEYADSWIEASELVKERYAKEAWERHLNGFARQVLELEPIKSRKLLSLESVKSSPSNHDRQCVELSYKTYFEKSGSLLQRLELVLDQDQVWRVADYLSALPGEFAGDASGAGSNKAGGMGPSNDARGGLGDGKGGGMGPGNGRGVGSGNGYNMGGGDLRLGGGSGAPAVDTKPVPLNQPHPQYTEEARKNKIQGNVTVRLLVGSDGSVKQVKITRGLPDGLDEQAIQAAYQLQIKPAMKGGNAVAYWIPVVIEFKLP